MKKIRKQVDREDGQLLILPSDKEEVGALSDPTVNLSAANIDNSSETAKESEGKDRQRYASSSLSEPRGEREQLAANERFNNELTRYQNGEMDKNEMLHLGRPQGVMRAFLPNLPIVMRQRILTKGSVKKHNVAVEALVDMPNHLSHPIFVFKRSDNVLGVLTEMQDRDGKNVCVAIELNRQIQNGGEILEVNDIRSVHGRNVADIVYPIVQNGTLKWVDKEKGLTYLSSASQYVRQEIDKQDLDTATKVVKDFVNPKESEGKDRQRYASSSLSEPRGEEAAEREATSVRLQKADIVDAEAMAEEYGLDADDVRRYAEGMRKGSSAQAARALAEISRKIIAAHEDEIHSLLDMRKFRKPVEKALKEAFGDVDVLIEERRKQIEEERNTMEAARKRAEEEQRKREVRLEELAVLTDEEIDHSYAEALAKGDVAAAREMLDEAARRKGYGDVRSDYQGVGAWVAPSKPDYETDEARRNAVGEDSPDLNVEDMAAGYSNQPEDIFVHPNKYSQGLPTSKESGNAIQTAIDDIRNGKKDVTVKVYRAVPTSVKEGKLRNGDWVTPSRKYAELHGSSRLEGKYRIIEDEVPVSELWWNGNDVNEWGYDNGKGYRYKNVKNNRKLNDLVTRDDNGNVIPPSKRFNQRKADERYQRGVGGVKPSKAEAVLRDAVIDRLRENGMEVITDVAEGQKVLDEANGEDVMLSAKQKRALETATMADESTNKATVVSSADGAKVQNNLEVLADSYKNRPNKAKGFITDLSRSLGLEQHEASQYGTFVTENGKTFTIRVSNHNARVSFFDKNGENDGISIVISNHKNKGLLNDGNAHIIEFFYSKQSLQRADSKPLSDIISSVSETLYSGEFKDTTGLAERQEVNAKKIREQRVYHGSGAHPLLSELRQVEQRDVIAAKAQSIRMRYKK